MGAGIRIDRALAWLVGDGFTVDKAKEALEGLTVAARWEGVPYYAASDLVRATGREID